MIPTEKGEAGNVCKDDENGKKRYNRINRSNSKIGNQSKTDPPCCCCRTESCFVFSPRIEGN